MTLLLPADGTGVGYELGSEFYASYGTTRLPIGATIGAIKLALTARHVTASTVVASGVTIGIGVFDESNDVQVPTPTTEPHADWMYWQTFFVGVGGGTSTSQQGMADGPFIKSMRKIEELGERLWLKAGINQFPDQDYTLSFSASTLILLP